MIDSRDRVEFLRALFGECDVAKNGLNVAFRCPACDAPREKRKLIVRTDNGLWHCWVCDSRGRSVASLLRKFHPDRVSEWNRRFDPNRRSKFDDDISASALSDVELPPCVSAVDVYDSSDPDYLSVVKYLGSRAIDYDTMYRYRLCIGTRGKFKRRVIIPSFSGDGELNYWTARSIDGENFRYVNPPVDRNSIVFNEVDVDWNRELLLVEGPFDMIRANRNCVPLLGSSLSKDSLLLRRLVENSTPVVLALDADACGKAHKIASTMYGLGLSVRMASLGWDKDVGEMSSDRIVTIVKDATSWSPMSRILFRTSNIRPGAIV